MVILCMFVIGFASVACTRPIPVFPGAQGFGTETKAGRGGKIIKVTNLNDSGTGSLRAAVEASGPRIVVFEVAGTIELSKDLGIRNPYITIAGQTAPSPGITLKDAGIIPYTHDILVQHLRFRVGDDPDGPDPSTRDSIKINGYTGDCYNVVLDHVSASWAVDENGSTYAAVKNVTVSNSIISEGLRQSLHAKGEHGYGFLIGDHAKRVSLVGNLFAHNMERNPLMKGDTTSVTLNNVMYNGGYRGRWTQFGGSAVSLMSVVGNVYIAGPNTPSSSAIVARNDISSGTKIYISDNVYGSGPVFKNEASFDPRVSSPPIWHASFAPRKASTVESWVLANAGARPADRDAVDERIVNEVKNRAGNWINRQCEVGGWPNFTKTVRPFPVPANPNGDDDGDGYTNIEEVLHQMAAEVEGR